MSNTELDHESAEFQEEWLSAYLDGELSSEQRELVEQRVAEDPTLATMLEDLRKVRSLVSSMPRWTEGELSTRDILARAGEIDDSDSEFAEDTTFDAEVAPLDEVDAIVHHEPEGGTTDEEFLSARLTQRASYMRWMRPAAMAASLLLIAGIGYTLWPTGPQAELASSTLTDSSTAPAGEFPGEEFAMQEDASEGLVPKLALPEPQSDLALKSTENSSQPSLPLPPPDTAIASRGSGFGGSGFGGSEFGGSGDASRTRALPAAPESLAPESFAMDADKANAAELPMPTLRPQLDSAAKQEDTLSMEMEAASDMSELTLPEVAAIAPMNADSGMANVAGSSSRAVFFARSNAWNESDVKAAIAASPDVFGSVSRSVAVQGQSGRGLGAEANAASMAILTVNDPDTQQTYNSLLSSATSLTPLGELNSSSEPPSLAANKPSMQRSLPPPGAEAVPEKAVVDELPPPAVSRKGQPAQTGLIALFLTKAEADELLQAPVLSQSTESKPGSVFWIVAGPSGGRSLQAGDRVILLLNSASP